MKSEINENNRGEYESNRNYFSLKLIKTLFNMFSSTFPTYFTLFASITVIHQTNQLLSKHLLCSFEYRFSWPFQKYDDFQWKLWISKKFNSIKCENRIFCIILHYINAKTTFRVTKLCNNNSNERAKKCATKWP